MYVLQHNTIAIDPLALSLAVVGDILISSFFAGSDKVGAAFGITFAISELGGALPFYMDSLLQSHFPKSYVQIVFATGAYNVIVATKRALVTQRLSNLLSCSVAAGIAACSLSLACLVITYRLDRRRFRAAVRAAADSTPTRSLTEYLAWILSVMKRQSAMFWLLHIEIVCAYICFQTFMAYSV